MPNMSVQESPSYNPGPFTLLLQAQETLFSASQMVTHPMALQNDADMDTRGTQQIAESKTLEEGHMEELSQLKERIVILEDWKSLMTRILMPEDGPSILEQVNIAADRSMRLENYYTKLYESMTGLEVAVVDMKADLTTLTENMT